MTGEKISEVRTPFGSFSELQANLDPHLPEQDEIYFAGGEPLISEEHYYVLKKLIDLNKTDIPLFYNTNLSNLMFKNENIIDLWKKFSSVSVNASLDGSGVRGEYIRHGQNWQQIENNRRDLLREVPHIQFEVNLTLSLLNSLHVTDFHRQWVEEGLINPEQFRFHYLFKPDIYRITALPENLKRVAEQKYRDHIEKFLLKFPRSRVEKLILEFESAINFMNSADDSRFLPQLRETTHRLDEIRGEKFHQVFPEFSELFKEV